MTTANLTRDDLVKQLEQELKLIEGTNTIEMALSDWLGNEGKWCTLSKECMPGCN